MEDTLIQDNIWDRIFGPALSLEEEEQLTLEKRLMEAEEADRNYDN